MFSENKGREGEVYSKQQRRPFLHTTCLQDASVMGGVGGGRVTAVKVNITAITKLNSWSFMDVPRQEILSEQHFNYSLFPRDMNICWIRIWKKKYLLLIK